MSVAEHEHPSTRLTVVAPKESFQRALPLPRDTEMAVEGLTNEEWDAFENALADRCVLGLD